MTHTADLMTGLPERLHGLDALRGMALLLGVALHASMSWLAGAEYYWIVSDTERSTTLATLFYLIHLFRMPLFFLLAGYFGRMSLQRLGTRAFVDDRRKRILMPLLMFWPMVFAGIIIAVVWAAWIKGGGSLPAESPPGPTFMPDDFPLTHLWFLYVLLLCYVGALAMRAVLALVDRRQVLGPVVDRLMRGLFGPWVAPLLATPAALCLATLDGWYAWFGVPTPDQSLYPNLPAAVSFGMAFGIGWLLQRQTKLLQDLRRSWAGHALLATAAIAICWSIVGLSPALEPAAPDAYKLIYALAYATASWAMTLALIGWTLRYLSGHSPVRRYLADASYWIYLVHLPVVMLLQVVTAQLNWPWWIEYPLLLTLGLAAMLASYQLMVRYSWIGDMLSGRRRVRGESASSAASPAVGRPEHAQPGAARNMPAAMP
jgi:glucans biosynthesis protein C